MNSDLEHLRKRPRFCEGSIQIDGFRFGYNDSHSFYHEYKNIFVNEIYKFQSDSDCPNIIDAGGYVGVSAIYFKKQYPKAKITVFEPDTKIFGMLKTNLKDNGFKDIIPVNVGVGKQNGLKLFYPDGADGGNVFHAKQEDSIVVKIEKLSKYINTDIDLLKINIEGMEGEVFEEIENKLPLIKEIICEYHAFYNLPQKLGAIITHLERNGFNYLVTGFPGEKRSNLLTVSGKYKYFNLIYAKKKSD